MHPLLFHNTVGLVKTHCFTLSVFEQKIQDMEERRIERVGESMKTFAELDRQILPIVGKCLDGITKAADSIEAKTVSPAESNTYIHTYTNTHITYYIHTTAYTNEHLNPKENKHVLISPSIHLSRFSHFLTTGTHLHIYYHRGVSELS